MTEAILYVHINVRFYGRIFHQVIGMNVKDRVLFATA